MARIVVGLSGGVDSSVTAYLLKKQGHEVIGMFMKNWHDDSVILDNECPWVEDSMDALLVAQKLGIPYQAIDLSEEYKERIVDYMFAEYEQGRTPNPDVLCNREIKFAVFLEKALELGADYVATGHYARKEEIQKDGKTVYRLLAGKDQNKDQSYFLCQLTQDQLAKALFPIGELEKSEVREIAAEQELVTADKKDSQGLCFIGKIKLPVFLQQQLSPKAGKIVEIAPDFEGYPVEIPEDLQERLQFQSAPYHHRLEDGEVCGDHDGAHFFTVGQRKGLGVGGRPLPLFVLEKNTDTNLLFVGQGDNHPGLSRKVIFIPQAEEHWIRPDLSPAEGEKLHVEARIRYRQKLSPAILYRFPEGIYLEFEEAQKGVAEGQFAAWYIEDELIGSGVMS